VTVTRFLRLLPALLLVGAVSLPAAAFANGHGGGFHGGGHGGHDHGHVHSHVFFGFGCCGGFWPGYYYPAYYPYYYGYPPYSAYPADPYAYSAPGAVYQAPAANCRQFNGDAIVDASGQPFFGTACVGSDGLWHVVGQ
jgi:hypothetical protein